MIDQDKLAEWLQEKIWVTEAILDSVVDKNYTAVKRESIRKSLDSAFLDDLRTLLKFVKWHIEKDKKENEESK